MAGDIYGGSVDSWAVEEAFKATLQAWLSAHLRHQEEIKGLPPRALPSPRSWPTRAALDLVVEDQMPAVAIVSPGTIGDHSRDQRGAYRVTWRIETAIAIAGRHETEGRMIASMYLAAIRDAMVQNQTLDGFAELCRWTGPDNHTPLATVAKDQRVIYSTEFAVTVRDVVNDTLGPVDPPPDPTDPGDPPPIPIDFDISIDIDTTEEP